ncbi:GNAT family N-acetyltransferase [Marinovum sp. 2_MG-2023]|uniref:GNAT family N-acetyltransferase n=1 Tax=unclassified Marinovum TaxID=2647166 RepID=UPI0026E27B97|nr:MULTISPECIES: GNAT family N-acetyltransferase [unclassified Marinovum]MDO6730719.1 GNAT family N-acetyltransferase [Marinovum sp. 2_MG-2023]MDO6780076.1 GNAT family N-acetyltransferase [Marinovum sp. 1_MG-2023]
MLVDGFHDVPKGKVAAVVTHLEMRSPPVPKSAALPAGLTISRVTDPDVTWYRDLFCRVGGQDWLWFSRLRLDDAALSAVLGDPGTEVFTVDVAGRAEGLLELDFRVTGECELAYFGLTSALIGKGAGRALMTFAIERAFGRPIERFHVHTCTLDSPQALGFYRRSGFTPIRQQIEIADDPRLIGDLPRDAGPHVPVFTDEPAFEI